MSDEIVDLSYSGWEPVTDRQLDVVRQQNREKNAEIVQLRADLAACRARLAALVEASDAMTQKAIQRLANDTDEKHRAWYDAWLVWAGVARKANDWLAQHPEAGGQDGAVR